MLVDPVRLVAEWLADPATGVNAHLPNVPRDPGEDPPDPATVVSELDDDRVARGPISRDLLNLLDDNAEPTPYLVVRMHEDEEQGSPPLRAQALPEYHQQDPTVVAVDVIYARRKIERAGSIVSVVSLKRDAQQAIRAAFRVVASQFASSSTEYVRNGCRVTLPPTGLLLNVHPVLRDDDVVVHALIVPLRVFDMWALALDL